MTRRSVKIFCSEDYKSIKEMENGINGFIDSKNLDTWSLYQSESKIVHTHDHIPAKNNKSHVHWSLTITLDYDESIKHENNT